MRDFGTPEMWRRAALAGLGVALIVVLSTFQDYGITWDAHYHMANGRHVLAYYASLFEDQEVLRYHNLYLYGGVFDGLGAVANLISPLGEYETSHLLNAVVGLVGVIGCWKLVDTIAGPRAASLAALFLLLTPPWYGHMFNNPKDIPFAAAMTWSLYYMVRLAEGLPHVPRRVLVKLGIALGLTLGMRIGGVIAFVYLGAGIAAYLLARWRQDGIDAAMRESGRVALRLVPLILIAYAVMLACWPWAQQDPLRNPIEALRLFSHIEWDMNVLFEGRLVNSLDLPPDYLPVYFAIKLPELVLILLLLAVPLGIGTALLRLSRGAAIRPAYVILFVSIAFPFVYFVLKRPVTYDCMRHFLFVLPPIAAAAGLVADHLVARSAGSGIFLRGAVISALALPLAWQVDTIVRLHPDQYVYYNELVGGVKGAEDNFELDYWGNSYAEAVEKLTEYLAREEEAGGDHRIYRVAVCASGTSASYFFPGNLALAETDFEADFYISVTRLGCDDELDGKEIARVERDGATLSVVKDRRALRLADPERMARLIEPPERVHPGAISELPTPAPH